MVDEIAVAPLFEKLPQSKTYEVVVDQIKAKIRAGELKPGSALPTERVLCESLGVSRSSVREALRTLEAIGIVEVLRGKGPGKGARVSPDPSGVLSELFQLNFSLHDWSLEHLVVARAAVERQAAMSGAKHNWSREEILEVEQHLKAMRTPCSPRDYYPIDMDFHLALAYRSNNPVLVTMMKGLRGAVADLMIEGFESAADWPKVQRRLTAEHAEIWRHFLAGNSAEAAEHLERHITGFYSQVLAVHRR